MAAHHATTALATFQRPKIELHTVGTFCFASLLVYMGVRSPRVLLATVLAYLLHEAGHIIACYLLDVRVKGVGCGFLGVFVRHASAASQKQNALIGAAGPLVSLAAAGMLWPGTLLHNWFAWLAFANLFTAALNLLPIPGSDGWRIWAALHLKP